MGKSVTLTLNLKTGSNSSFKDAVVALTREIQTQQQSVVKLNAALDSTFLKDRVRLTNEITEAQGRLNAALATEQRAQGIAFRDKTDDERHVVGSQSIHAATEGQKQTLATLALASDPAAVRESVALENALVEAHHKLNDLLENEQKLQGVVVTHAITDDERRLKSLKSVNEALEQQQQHLDYIAAQSTPKAIQQRVALQLQTEESQKKLTFAEHKERAKQLGPGKALMDLFNFPDLTSKLTEWGGKLSGIGESMGGKWGGKLKSFGDFLGGPAAKTPTHAPSITAPAAKTPTHAPSITAPAAKTPTPAPSITAPTPKPTALAAPPTAAPTGGAAEAGAGAEAAGAGAEAAGAGAAAAAGPIGIAIAAAIALAPVVKKLASAPFDVVAGGLNTITKGLQGLTGPLGPVGSILDGVADAGKTMGDKLKYVSPLMAGVAEGIGEVAAAISGFLNVAVQLAQKANPSTVQRLGFAIDDTAAVIGHRMLPVVKLLTEVVRGIGDVLNTIMPSTSEFRSALAPLGEAFEEIKEDFTPFIHLLKVVFTGALRSVGDGLRVLWEIAKPFVKLASLTIPGLPKGELDSSQGAAARGAKFQDYQSYAHQAYASALSSQGVDPSKETAKNTGKTNGLLTSILQVMLGFDGDGNSIALDLADPFNIFHRRRGT